MRNSGATVVVEGVGHHGCEYMTSGLVLILGRTGSNFAAGMTGGRAFVLDMDERFIKRCNKDQVTVGDLDTAADSADLALVKSLIAKHVAHTGSVWGARLLENFEHYMFYFRAVTPKQSPRMESVATIPLRVVK